MDAPETAEASRMYTIQSNTVFDHGMPHKVVGRAAKCPNSHHLVAVAPKVTGRHRGGSSLGRAGNKGRCFCLQVAGLLTVDTIVRLAMAPI